MNCEFIDDIMNCEAEKLLELSEQNELKHGWRHALSLIHENKSIFSLS